MRSTEHTEELKGFVYTVWIGGIEVNDHYVNFDDASKTAMIYRLYGFDDVVIETEQIDTSEEDNVD